MITVALLVVLVGLALYLPSLTPKVNRIGEICIFCGLLAMLLSSLGARVLV